MTDGDGHRPSCYDEQTCGIKVGTQGQLMARDLTKAEREARAPVFTGDDNFQAVYHGALEEGVEDSEARKLAYDRWFDGNIDSKIPGYTETRAAYCSEFGIAAEDGFCQEFNPVAVVKQIIVDTKHKVVDCAWNRRISACGSLLLDGALVAVPYGAGALIKTIVTARKVETVAATSARLKNVPDPVEPSAQQIIQSTARAEAGKGVEALSGSLSAAERAAMAENPRLTNAFLGQAVHRDTAAALEEAFPGRFWYRTRGPDFVDRWTGEMLELTTPGQVGSHRARPGYADVTMCTYVMPVC